ncbi:MAG: cobalt-precorrin 5A hydrolase [Clostridia bacterium]|nr:cobalt-precorrin 5A hydrolase [Clostridia bacterium]
MKTAYFYLTTEGKLIAEKLYAAMGGTIFEKAVFKESVKKAFYQYEALVFIMAAGIAVRMIAPLLQSKQHDPAVVVLDQSGRFCISLLSGHIGGANTLSVKIADILGATPVITTATDVKHVCSFDLFAKSQNAYIENIEELKYISSYILEGNSVDFVSGLNVKADFGINVNIVKNFRENHSVIFDIYPSIMSDKHILYIRPKCLFVGIGCKRGTAFEYLEKCFLHFLNQNNVSIYCIKGVSTIALKKDEPCINELCGKYNIPMTVVEIDEINLYADKFEVSDYVKKVTGAVSVAEGSCYIASGKGTILCKKTKYDGVTLALSMEENVYEFYNQNGDENF